MNFKLYNFMYNYNNSLKCFNTFRLNIYSEKIFVVSRVCELIKIFNFCLKKKYHFYY